MRSEDDLSPEDLERVKQYLNSPIHQRERRPFKFWHIFGGLMLMLLLFGVYSLWEAQQMGAI